MIGVVPHERKGCLWCSSLSINFLIHWKKKGVTNIFRSNNTQYTYKTFCWLRNIFSRAVVWRCPIKKVLWKIYRNPQEKTCFRSFFSWSCWHAARSYIKKRIQHRSFPVNFAKFLEHFFHITPPGNYFCL